MKKKLTRRKIEYIKLKLKILVILLIIIAAIISIFVKGKKTNQQIFSPKALITKSYEIVQDKDVIVNDDDNKEIKGLEFDAFFLSDNDEGDNANRVRGTCNRIGEQSKLYFKFAVKEEGYIKDAVILINSNNFYLSTAIIKDNEVANNCISPNTKRIELNTITTGIEKILMGEVRSGNYKNTGEKREAIGNDTRKYSLQNWIVFSGTYVENGKERHFTKKVPINIDWYGEVDCNIESQSQTKYIKDLNELKTDEGVCLDVSINCTETLNELIMYGSYISGTIPELHGYKPISVEIIGNNVKYNYNTETGEFIAQREAKINANGNLISNAYTDITVNSRTSIRNNKYDLKIVYPIEAFEGGEESIKDFDLSIPIKAINKAYNNPNTEYGFLNPQTSNVAEGIVLTHWSLREEEGSLGFGMEVGSYIGLPYYRNLISKDKPMNIYNGKSLEEKDDIYVVRWSVYAGTEERYEKLLLSDNGKADELINSKGERISMEDFVTNRGIYFSGATASLGSNGWIKVFNDENDTLIAEFNDRTWNYYTYNNPYLFDASVKHIRVESSRPQKRSNFNIYCVKELDDDYITKTYDKEEFVKFIEIASYFKGITSGYIDDSGNTIWQGIELNSTAMYRSRFSIASFSTSIENNTLSTQVTAKNEKITIKTEEFGNNESKWKNGIFLVKLPENIISTEINSITIDKENVNISAYDVYEENGNYFIRILTENEIEDLYTITIDCDLTPDPRGTKTESLLELYAINELGSEYYYNKEDIYDADGDDNLNEIVNYQSINITFNPGSSLNTTQIASNYDKNNSITIAPRIAVVDREQRTATITISAINNYEGNLQNVRFHGVIPFKGNKYVLSGTDMESTFSTSMTSKGIEAVTPELKNKITVYYSTEENTTNDENDLNNKWVLANEVTDWNAIKSYMVIVDNSFDFIKVKSLELKYEIYLPENVKYNEITYSEHALYYALSTDKGLLYGSTACSKLGLMIGKPYTLEIEKYQRFTDKKISGVMFSLTEEGKNSSTIKVTNKDGKIVIPNLFLEKVYILKEENSTDDYVLNNKEIKFYTYLEKDAEGKEILRIVHINDDGTYSNLNDIYYYVRNSTTSENTDGFSAKLEIDNEIKSKLKIKKTDSVTGEPLKNIKFTLSGKGKNGEILTTNSNGEILVSGLWTNEEYILKEVEATGYYLEDDVIFKVLNNNGKFELIFLENSSKPESSIEDYGDIPIVKFNIINKKIPTYGLQLTKYAKDETIVDENGIEKDKTLANVQYRIYGEGIPSQGKVYTTNENGILKIDGLYEYVEGKNISGEYILEEIYAPPGYSVNLTKFKFKLERNLDGQARLIILEGENVLRKIKQIDDNTGEEIEVNDLKIVNQESSYPIVNVGLDDIAIFSLYKYSNNSITKEKQPIAGTKFIITDLEGNYVKGTDGKFIGEYDPLTDRYIVETDSNGLITANIGEGTYKAIEIETPEGYILPEKEEDRTYYFYIGPSESAKIDWINSIRGKGWNYINSVASAKNNETIAVGTFSEYSILGSIGGIDVNNDEIIDKISEGNDDGIIISYNSLGEINWYKTFGSTGDDGFNKVIQTSDKGYIVVGYVSGKDVKYDGNTISNLTQKSGSTAKDALLLKIDSSGNYQWGVRLGGIYEDEITSVIETSQKNIVILGEYNSSTFNFYDKDNSSVRATISNTSFYANGFIASYSFNGEYQWCQGIKSQNSNVVVSDILEYSNGLLVALNNDSRIIYPTLTTQSPIPIYSGIVEYSLDGSYRNIFKNIANTYEYNKGRIESIDIAQDNSIIAGINVANSKYTETDSRNFDSYIYKINIDGNNIQEQLLYSLTGSLDEFISDVEVTPDNGILFGGWYYSNDINGEGLTEEYTLDGTPNAASSYGYVIKLDSNYKVEYSSTLKGENLNGVNSVTETGDGRWVAGGFFSSNTLTATNFKKEEENTREIEVCKSLGNFEGFVISEGASSAIVATKQSLEIENILKQFTITTEVRKHLEGDKEVEGGKILTSIPNENVYYGYDSKGEIKIVPDNGYIIKSIEINGNSFNQFTLNEDGSTILDIFKNVKENIHIVVEFAPKEKELKLIVNHYLWKGSIEASTESVATSEYYIGEEGQEYIALPNVDIDYDLITNREYYGEKTEQEILEILNVEKFEDSNYKSAEDFLNDIYIPQNYKGIYTSENPTIIVNYYYKELTYKLTVHHYLEGTDEPVPLKDSSNTEILLDPDERYTENLYHKGDEYETTQAPDTRIDYKIYELVSLPENSKGIIEENTEVIYYYRVRTTNLNILKVAKEDNDVKIGDTEFSLYRLVCNEHDETYHDSELIDCKNVSACWEKVKDYTTSNKGTINLSDLNITYEYRLVETKAVSGRHLPSGQWKIKFEIQENPIPKITALKEAPDVIIQENGDILIINSKEYEFPTTGGENQNVIAIIGFIIAVISWKILFYRKKKTVKINKRLIL